MGKLLDSYNPKLPIFLARKAQEFSYDPDKYMGWYLKARNLDEKLPHTPESLTKPSKIVVGFAYYFWVVYLAASLTVIVISPIVGLFAVLISPFLVIGVTYSLIYTFWTMHFKHKIKDELPKPAKPKPAGKKSTKKQAP